MSFPLRASSILHLFYGFNIFAPLLGYCYFTVIFAVCAAAKNTSKSWQLCESVSIGESLSDLKSEVLGLVL